MVFRYHNAIGQVKASPPAFLYSSGPQVAINQEARIFPGPVLGKYLLQGIHLLPPSPPAIPVSWAVMYRDLFFWSEEFGTEKKTNQSWDVEASTGLLQEGPGKMPLVRGYCLSSTSGKDIPSKAQGTERPEGKSSDPRNRSDLLVGVWAKPPCALLER